MSSEPIVQTRPGHAAARARRGAADTREKLLRAAIREFAAHGFSGTDTNKIARRAGFAPQTFYRWFADKLEIFLVAYRQWEDEEAELVASLTEKRAGAAALADAIVAHHRAHLLFRRSLRQLSVESPAVRKARAQSRLRQIRNAIALTGAGSVETLAPLLLQIERLADAVAERELEDLGLNARVGRAALAKLLSPLRGARTRRARS